nr:hypothetical protein [uncultured Ralstonia sp.]
MRPLQVRLTDITLPGKPIDLTTLRQALAPWLGAPQVAARTATNAQNVTNAA